jgi:hypothetical protein
MIFRELTPGIPRYEFRAIAAPDEIQEIDSETWPRMAEFREFQLKFRELGQFQKTFSPEFRHI